MGNDRRGSGFFSGFILGGIVGAIAAFILSQKSARDTLNAKMKDIITQARETIREAIEEGREAAVRKEAELRDDQEKEKAG